MSKYNAKKNVHNIIIILGQYFCNRGHHTNTAINKFDKDIMDINSIICHISNPI